MEPKDGRLRIGDPFGPARPNDDDESSSWPSPGMASRGTKRGRDIVGGSDATERSERFVADLCAHRPVSRRVDGVEDDVRDERAVKFDFHTGSCGRRMASRRYLPDV